MRNTKEAEGANVGEGADTSSPGAASTTKGDEELMAAPVMQDMNDTKDQPDLKHDFQFSSFFLGGDHHL